MNPSWYALHVKPHKERTVYQQLRVQQIEIYFPSLKVKPKNPRAAKVRPYFPGYMFVHLDLETAASPSFKWMPGTYGLVSFGETPITVPENFISELRKRIAAIEAAGGLPQPRLQAGDTVKIVNGPFAGYEAIFDAYLSGRERVQILLSFLGNRPKRIQLDADNVEKSDKDRKA